MAASLSEAHGSGLIHRDIKPGNVIVVAERGVVPDIAKVVDFGLVKELDKNLDLTREIRIAGTPHYLSPEAISSPDKIGPQSDLYSLGCVAYYLLTSQHVFDGNTVVEVCSHHLHSQPIPPSARLGRPVPESLAAVVMQCLEKMPEHRPASAQALVDKLANCRDVEPWTPEVARVWWNERGREIMTQARRQHADTDVTSSPTASLDLSLIRPRDARSPVL